LLMTTVALPCLAFDAHAHDAAANEVSMPWRTAFSTSGCSKRHTRLRAGRVNLPAHGQAIAEAHLLDRR